MVIEGVGAAGFSTATPNLNWKELMYHAASRAYDDAGGIDPRRSVDGFITCAEDYWEGFGIFDEFTPDQLGGVLRPNFTVGGDGLHGLAQAFMIIRTGLMNRVVVEAHSKASDMATYRDILLHAFDPIWHKPLSGDPHFLAGLEMARFLSVSGASEEDCARVVVKNRKNARSNVLASYDSKTSIADVLSSPKISDPLKHLDIAPLTDGCVVFVLANKKFTSGDRLVTLKGIGWNEDTPFPESRADMAGVAGQLALKQACKVAKVDAVQGKLDLAEIDDQFSFKELQHLEALGLAPKGHAHTQASAGRFDADGELPVNISGGSLGIGNLLEAKGAGRAMEVVQQLRGEAGRRQVDEAALGMAHTWRGLPTASHAVALFSNGGGS